jgi:hypothetical protein
MMFGARVQRAVAACSITATLMTAAVRAQDGPHERVFPQNKATVEKVLQTLQPNLAGHLPTLEGFAKPGDRPLDRYERGYYETTVKVTAMADGSSLVRATSKVTAWYSDPAGFHSGYQLLPSNGRIEEDLLDQLAEQLARLPAEQANRAAPVTAPKLTAETPAAASAAAARPPNAGDRASSPATSAATPKPAAAAPPPSTGSDIPAPSSVLRSEQFAAPSSPRLNGTGLAGAYGSSNPAQPGQPNADKPNSALEAEAEGLEEILKNQGHPNNLVAVKKSGTAVVGSPSLTAKPLFLASMHDEFEMLDFNRDWVHVRISGLSRGWIWRNAVEMPAGIPDTDVSTGPAPAAAADLFRVSREETSQFPGDWEPLRGKNVKIFSVEKTDENAKDTGPRERLEYAKYLLEKTYTEMAQKEPSLAGIVLIFDSADGGMIAATITTLQQWKIGALSDSAMWHKCFFDPPETFDSSRPSGSQ